MTTLQTQDGYQKKLYAFMQVVDVVCPSCGGHAIVTNPALPPQKNEESLIRVVCETCGFNKRLDEKRNAVMFSSPSATVKGKFQFLGVHIDPYFHLPMWLTINCCNEILWAYNYGHLEFLRAHVDAKLRERNITEMSNRSVGSRLPKWMTSKKNRETVLKAIAQLKNK
jgi:hypothetical protein